MKGALVVLEGIDGVGKHTQTVRLSELASAAGLKVTQFSFPRYGDNPFSSAIARYLNGEFGAAHDVAPELAALLYAGDRFTARCELQAALSDADLVICDRYVSSNIAHQGAKLERLQRPNFVRWLSKVEYEIFGLPLPDLTLLLDMPVLLAAKQVAMKRQRSYTDRKADIHEEDLEYLGRCQEVYSSLLAEPNFGKVVMIDCSADKESARPQENIAADVWSHVKSIIPKAALS